MGYSQLLLNEVSHRSICLQSTNTVDQGLAQIFGGGDAEREPPELPSLLLTERGKGEGYQLIKANVNYVTVSYAVTM